jgi:hypothetical protein
MISLSLTVAARPKMKSATVPTSYKQVGAAAKKAAP